jgi:MFS family permease
MFIIPVVVLFWQENGLSLTQIMILQALFAMSIVIFEVPTGVVADKQGRKRSMIYGSLFLILGALIYSLGHNFFQFFIAEFTWGIGACFFQEQILL